MKILTNLRLRTGDTVKVITGINKGKISEIVSINKKKKTAIVKNINLAIKHSSPKTKDAEGERKQIEKPIHISNLMFYDKETNTRNRIGYFYGEPVNTSGKKIKIRYQKKTGKKIS